MNPSNESEALRALSEPQAITEDVPGRQAEAREKFTVDWGIRVTDGALVMHFYPAMVEGGFGTWDPNYVMDVRLKHAIDTVLNPLHVTAGYEQEYDSFYIIYGGGSLDPRMLVHRFLSEVEGCAPN